ncbi:Molecular chaperone (small heat-shock protein Hsp26/Hsp42) [Handroanthus impetiginosus]|uniref:Molecular chaperone (Small heat-shock protein Hsp26/Hsp42) n=1 Tax=Handroanthus impetiginosus TaxID=429701 RepID=A0A2G9I6I8_9LAMI|nr:Molecular chaperone (small heat-shock protein Hsp26/Hsp42) [Handroanthus impetiginosus]
MALARLALKNLQQRGTTSASLLSRNVASSEQKQGNWGLQILRRLSSGAAEEKAEGGREVAVAEGGKKSRVFPRRRSRRGLWRNNNRDFVPALWEFFPSGLGNALVQATENINRLLENIAPSQLIGRAKEQDDCYKLQYHVPGLGKDDVKITVDDGVLNIRGEHKEEEEEGSDDEFWSARSYGYYNSSVVLPEDAKVEGIKAELKDGVLNIVIPKSERVKKDVKEIEVQ